MRRLSLMLIAVAVLAGVGVMTAGTARADQWCWDDPVVLIGGRSVQIVESIYGDPATVDANTLFANVVIHVPTGTPTAVVSVTKEYFREKVWFVYDQGTYQIGQPVPVRVDVTFQAKADMPARLDVSYLGSPIASATGSTFGQMSVSFTLP